MLKVERAEFARLFREFVHSYPAIVSALREATGQKLMRVPVRPEHIVGLAEAKA